LALIGPAVVDQLAAVQQGTALLIVANGRGCSVTPEVSLGGFLTAELAGAVTGVRGAEDRR
jgi:hypothetical protein